MQSVKRCVVQDITPGSIVHTDITNETFEVAEVVEENGQYRVKATEGQYADPGYGPFLSGMTMLCELNVT